MKLLRLWAPVIFWMVVIFIFSNRERVSVSSEQVVNFLFFKTLHVLEYAFLYLLSFRAVRNSFPRDPPFLWHIAAFAIIVVYALSDELHQTFVPTREGKLRDVIIDASGGAIVWFSIVRLLPKAPLKLRKLAGNWQLS